MAAGRRVTLDALREELGNTGSRATIHRYLKEIEAEEGGSGLDINQALQKLVADLAERLRLDADEIVASARVQHAAELAAKQTELHEREVHILALEQRIAQLAQQLENTQQQLAASSRNYQAESQVRAALMQQVRDLEAARQEDVHHRQRAEQVANDARIALEHFRAAAKEQREALVRQHEQQTQFLQAELRGASQQLVGQQQQVAQANQQLTQLTLELADARRHAHAAQQREAADAQTVAQLREACLAADTAQRQSLQALAEARGQLNAQAEMLASLKPAGARKRPVQKA